MARAAASASSSGLSRWIGRAEHGQRGVALELVDEPVVAVDLLDDHREEAVQQIDHLGRRAWLVTNWVEPMMSTKITATWRSSPPSFGRSRSRGRGDLATDVAAEQIAHAFAFAQAVRPSS